MAADQFAAAGRGESSFMARLGSMPICGRFIR
jgi:hypothetical protein